MWKNRFCQSSNESRGHKNVVDQTGNDFGKRTADHHADGHIDDIALESKGLEFLPHSDSASLLVFRISARLYLFTVQERNPLSVLRQCIDF